MRRAFLHLGCAFLLLSAQLTALTHSVWHLHHSTPAYAQEAGSGAAPQGGDESPSPQAELCVFHAAFSGLFAAGCSAPLAFLSADLPDWPATSIADALSGRSALTPPSRAPPVLV
jgi:hypothetical protein